MRASTVAVSATTANFAISDGWTVNPATAIHRAAPPATVPTPGISTTTRSAADTTVSGRANRCQATTRIRDVTNIASDPSTA